MTVITFSKQEVDRYFDELNDYQEILVEHLDYLTPNKLDDLKVDDI